MLNYQTDVIIEKVIILKVNKNNLIVCNSQRQKGIIYISEVGNYFISDLESMFSIGDIIYAQLVHTYKYKRFYSLKNGHTATNKFIKETGGGMFSLLYSLEKLNPAKKDI